jgi:hypothetical protein
MVKKVVDPEAGPAAAAPTKHYVPFLELFRGHWLGIIIQACYEACEWLVSGLRGFWLRSTAVELRESSAVHFTQTGFARRCLLCCNSQLPSRVQSCIIMSTSKRYATHHKC